MSRSSPASGPAASTRPAARRARAARGGPGVSHRLVVVATLAALLGLAGSALSIPSTVPDRDALLGADRAAPAAPAADRLPDAREARERLEVRESQEAREIQEVREAAATRSPTVDDILDLVGVSDARISPDGGTILYTRRELNWDDNRYDETVWAIEVGTDEHYRFLGRRSDEGVEWSPDGSWVAFRSSRPGDDEDDGGGGQDGDGDGPAQLWIIRADGGEAVQLTDHVAGVAAFEWLPDSSGLVFSADDRDPDELRRARKLGEDAIFVDEGPNGQGREFWRHLWLVELPETPGTGTAEARRLTDGERVVQSFDVSPDGDEVVFTFRPDNHRNAGHRAEVAVVRIAEAGAEAEVRVVTDNDAPEADPRWSPDGDRIAFLTPDDETWRLANDRFRLLDVASGEIRTPPMDFPEGSILGYEWAPDGSGLVFTAQVRTRRNVFRLALEDGGVTPLTEFDGLVSASSFSADGRYAAAVMESPVEPGDVYRLDLGEGRLERLTRVNPQVSELALATPRVVRWDSTDDFEIEGIVYLPPGHREGESAPLLLNIHGGPAGVFGYGFEGIWHVYAARGWVTLAPNVRGSSGYTDRLLRGNMRDIGGGDHRDLMAGVDRLVDDGLADPARMALRGWSYGGILGGWTITQTDRFEAASLGAMVSDWRSEYAMGFNFDVSRWYIGGTPWDDPEAWIRMSPYTHVADVSTPTILLHGEKDTTDTVGQSMIFYQGLKDRGVPVRFIRFPREPHGLREPHHQRTRHVEEIRWLERHTLGVEYDPGERPVSTDDDRAADEESDDAG